MIHEIHEISFRGHVARLATYFLDNSPEIDSGRIRPVVVVCPGGGYEMTSDREAEAGCVRVSEQVSCAKIRCEQESFCDVQAGGSWTDGRGDGA